MQSAKARIRELTEKLEYHNNLYYNQDAPEITDYEYDMLLRELENLEAQFPSLRRPDSPTNRVGGSLPLSTPSRWRACTTAFPRRSCATLTAG